MLIFGHESLTKPAEFTARNIAPQDVGVVLAAAIAAQSKLTFWHVLQETDPYDYCEDCGKLLTAEDSIYSDDTCERCSSNPNEPEPAVKPKSRKKRRAVANRKK